MFIRARKGLTHCLRSGIIVSQTSFYKFVLPLLKQLGSKIKSFKRCNSKARLLPVLPHTDIGSGETEAQRLRTSHELSIYLLYGMTIIELSKMC